MASDLAYGCVFPWRFMCGAGPGRLWGIPGPVLGCKANEYLNIQSSVGPRFLENQAENIRPDCLHGLRFALRADFSWKSRCGAGPGDLREITEVGFG